MIHNEGGVLSPPGSGAPYNEIRNAILYRGVDNVGIFGYSHGGGSTYLLAKYMNDLRLATPPRFPEYNLLFTGYIDGIERGTGDPQVLRPPGSKYHLNQYQRNGTLFPGDNTLIPGVEGLMGDETIGDAADTKNLNQSVRRINGELVVHVSIPNQEDVRNTLLDTLRDKIPTK